MQEEGLWGFESVDYVKNWGFVRDWFDALRS
jgi:hypothetical protein